MKACLKVLEMTKLDPPPNCRDSKTLIWSAALPAVRKGKARKQYKGGRLCSFKEKLNANGSRKKQFPVGNWWTTLTSGIWPSGWISLLIRFTAAWEKKGTKEGNWFTSKIQDPTLSHPYFTIIPLPPLPKRAKWKKKTAIWPLCLSIAHIRL